VISTASAARRRMGAAMERYRSGEAPSVSGQGELARHYGGERAAVERVALRYGGGLGKIVDHFSGEDGDL
jgi:hypothetical protein